MIAIAKDAKDFATEIKDFPEDWQAYSMSSYLKQLFNSVRWVGEAPHEVLDGLINGDYLIYDENY